MYLTALIISLVFRTVFIPVQFQDCRFTVSEQQIQQSMEAAQAYMDSQFRGTMQFSFMLAPTVTLSKDQAFYGANFRNEKDIQIRNAVVEACAASAGSVDFSKLDGDSDGFVDCVVIVAAGPSESDNAGEDCIWPQYLDFSRNAQAIGVQGALVDKVLTVCELKTDSGEHPRPGGPSVICHEMLHLLGLPDFYDTDLNGSGGYATNTWGPVSIMNQGTFNNDGNTPPNLNAVEIDLLGLGTCIPLQTGLHTLSPIGSSASYIKAAAPVAGDYFLIECRAMEGNDRYIGGEGLLIYHVDRRKESMELWESNMVNCDPGHQCVELCSAIPGSKETGSIFFPQKGRTCFASDTEPPFMFWDGRTSPIALTDIRRNADGSISFNAVEPLHLDAISVFQDGAIINWHSDEHFPARSITLEWSGENGVQERVELTGASSYIMDKLRPHTTYVIKISANTETGQVFSVTGSFTTKSVKTDVYPYIYLRGASRRPDGSFFPNSQIALKVFNALDAEDVEWFFNDSPIRPEADGFFTIRRSGVLRAVVHYSDGSKETIIKEITVK